MKAILVLLLCVLSIESYAFGLSGLGGMKFEDQKKSKVKKKVKPVSKHLKQKKITLLKVQKLALRK